MTTSLAFSVAMQVATQKSSIHKLGIAVSGGGDSMALLRLAHEWTGLHSVKLVAATVNHGLRPEAADEAKLVASTCAGLEISHETLHWKDWNGQGNLQDAARRARYRLLASWAQKNALDTVALGHTENDKAETFLMRLARGSGVDGLSAMRRDWQANGTRWLRPLLFEQRQTLRDYLKSHGQEWADDPSNEDLQFDRVKARAALHALAGLGLTVGRLADTADNMAQASHALQSYTFKAAKQYCRLQYGDVVISRDVENLPPDILYRLVSHALKWVSHAQYRPRYDALVEVWGAALSGKRRTLHGCLISPEPGVVRISREYQAVKGEACALDRLWDVRWKITGSGEGLEIRALGEAVKNCADWRETGLPRASLMASPAIWRGADLVAAPLAGLANGYSAKIHPDAQDFYTCILSH